MMPAALQKPLSSSRPEMVAAHVPLALHDGVFVPARTVVAGRYARHPELLVVAQLPAPALRRRDFQVRPEEEFAE